MKNPIEYIPNYCDCDIDSLLELPWERHTSARKELFYSSTSEPVKYTYGQGEFARTYTSKPAIALVQELSEKIATDFDHKEHELCFMNRYDDQHQALGWHADDDQNIDHERSIAVISFGAERQLWIKQKGSNDVERIVLGHGSLLIMKPGMQSTHLHRIPKHDRPCGTRISLTYRGLKSASGKAL